MSNLSKIAKFFEWVDILPFGTHLGNEIRARAPDLHFVPFFIERPYLQLFVRVCIDGEEKPIKGFVHSIVLDPEKNRFSISISTQFLKGITADYERECPFEKLKSLRELTQAEVSAELDLHTVKEKKMITDVPQGRIFECDPQNTNRRSDHRI